MATFARSSRPSRPDKGRGKKICVLLCLTAAVFAVLLALPGCGKGGGEKGDDVAVSRVPDVVGMTEEEATEAIEGAGLEVGEVAHEVSDEVGIGLVMSQDPEPNTKQEEGTAVDLVVSDGPEHGAPDTSAMVEVPNLAHMTPAQAEAALGKLGLKAKRGEDVPAATLLGATVRVGRVGAQTPAPGAGVAPGMTVTYQLAKADDGVEVPSVTGKSKDDAVYALEAAGFEVSVQYDYSDSVAEGKVISQSPSAGSGAGKGSTVTIVVSLGSGEVSNPATVTVPDVAYLSYDDAVYNVQDRGLDYTIDYAYSDDVAYGYAVGTSPAAGTEVPAGSTVTIIISEGTGGGGVSYVAVPPIVNNYVDDAVSSVEAAGLVPQVQWYADVAPYGYVYDCYPMSGVEGEPGTTVYIFVSDGSGYDGGGS